jgi:tetratricopeptide (TPR) repeat protein
MLRRWRRGGDGSRTGTRPSAPSRSPDADEDATTARFRELLNTGVAQVKSEQFEKAAESFAAAEAAVPEKQNSYRVLVKGHRAGALFATRRFDEALAIYEELIADPESLARFPPGTLPGCGGPHLLGTHGFAGGAWAAVSGLSHDC